MKFDHMTVGLDRYRRGRRGVMKMISPYDPNDLLSAHHNDARERHPSEQQRVVAALRRARRMQRWADRLQRLSNRMSRTARLRLARLP